MIEEPEPTKFYYSLVVLALITIGGLVLWASSWFPGTTNFIIFAINRSYFGCLLVAIGTGIVFSAAPILTRILFQSKQ